VRRRYRLCNECYQDNERRLASTRAAKCTEHLAVVHRDNTEGLTESVTLESRRPVGAGDDSVEHSCRSEVDNKKGKGRVGDNPTNTSSGRSSKNLKVSKHPSLWRDVVQVLRHCTIQLQRRILITCPLNSVGTAAAGLYSATTCQLLYVNECLAYITFYRNRSALHYVMNSSR
jgi:hypothetical protein